MIFPPPSELSMLGVYDAGIPNQERILLRPTEQVNLAQFGVLVGVRIASGDIIPLQDNFYWFGEIQIPSPSWIVLATGKGDASVTNHPKTGHPVFWFFWGKSATIFNGPIIMPIVFQIGSILLGNNVPKQLPPSKV
jgi:hypothetical protein